MKRTACYLLLLLLPVLAGAYAEGRKVALVIGNSNYASRPLRNPANDAEDLATALRGIGFTVSLAKDAGKKAMYQLVDQFGADIRGAETALFYYSGHGVQVNGENYLIPVGAEISLASDVEIEGVQLARIMGRLDAGWAGTNVVILDACRNNPFPQASRGMEKGLAVVAAKPPESVIVYATEANETADDGAGRNGAFTAALLKNIGRREEFTAILRDVNAEVRKETGQKQKPAKYDNLTRPIYLAGLPSPSAPPPAAPAAAAPPAAPPAASPKTDGAAVDLGRFVRLPGGSFMMGSPAGEKDREFDEGPRRAVRIAAFIMGKYEVSFEEYDQYCSEKRIRKPSDSGWGRGSRPVINVSWYDAVGYCNWRSAKEGLNPAYAISGDKVAWNRSADGYRLPTEAEWEFACRAGTSTAYSFGDAIDMRQANFDGGGLFDTVALKKTAPIGSYPPNPWGLHDLHGNVSEWCWDWYGAEYYASGPGEDPLGPAVGSERAGRGGSWLLPPQSQRSANRNSGKPDGGGDRVGFRLARRP